MCVVCTENRCVKEMLPTVKGYKEIPVYTVNLCILRKIKINRRLKQRCKKKEDKILTYLISESLIYEFLNYIKKCIMFPRFKTDLFLLICREKNMCTDEVTLV